nr:SpoIVB peptidase S55 domain-containing protein [Paraclostridium sp. AKS81]
MELNTEKVMIFGIEKNSFIKNYDLIDCVSGDSVKRIFNQNEKNILSKRDIITTLISMKEDEKINLSLIRNNKKIKVSIDKKQLKPEYLVDKIPYTATLTYINPQNLNFGAVGHDIEFKGNEKLITNKGEIYKSNLSRIKKSSKNYVGNISGDKSENLLGTISNIGSYSVKGNVNFLQNNKENKICKIANENEVKIGQAFVVMKHNENEAKYYKINVTKINKIAKEIESFDFKVEDEQLIKNMEE